jgi:hypothetical protein
LGGAVVGLAAWAVCRKSCGLIASNQGTASS